MTPVNEGKRAYESGLKLSDNPYQTFDQRADWMLGWLTAKQAKEDAIIWDIVKPR